MKKDNKKVGNLGENIANKYLEKINCIVLDKNFSCNYGEIDLIFKDKDELVFAEVKSRRGVCYGFPAEAVNKYKKKHICMSAKYYLYKKNIKESNIRFDVIEIYFLEKKNVVNHIKNAFECEFYI